MDTMFGYKEIQWRLFEKRDKNQRRNGYYVINLDDQSGPGTHWVVMNIKPNIMEYFDSFGLNFPTEVIELSDKLNLNFVYISAQYQDVFSVLCGYYCLYFVNESSKGKSYHEIIKTLSLTDIGKRKIHHKVLKIYVS